MKQDDKIYFDLERIPLKSEREEMKRKRRSNIAKILSCLLILFIGIGLGFFIRASLYPNRNIGQHNIMSEIEYLMKKNWLYGSEYEDLESELEQKAYLGMTTFEDDPYTGYMSKEEMEEFANAINLDYVGIGVQYSSLSGVPLVIRVFKDSPAEKAGILAGDIIKTIDGVTVDENNIDDVKELVTGERGTEVVLGIQRENDLFEIGIIRDSISSTVYASLEDDVVILEISSFGETTAAEIENYLNDYEDNEKLIIDVRNNTGGYQTSVRDCLRAFIGDGKPYLKQKDVNGKEEVEYTIKNGKVFENFDDIVILINDTTASAAEVFALVMKEEVENVTLVGETTYGKGVIQTNKYLSDGSILKLTSYYWYSPKGTSIHKEGISPDIEVFMPDIYYESYYSMEDDETYEYDEVSDSIRTSQIALDFLGYDVERSDGYFDESFTAALNDFKHDNDLEEDGILNSETFEKIIAKARFVIGSDGSKDTQMLKAIEVLHEN